MHLLLWLTERIKLDEVDKIISAEIPDKETDPELFDIVTKYMIHGPCGALNPNCVCMSQNRCTKDFPKEFCRETLSGNDGYPKYQRRSPEDGGNTFTIKRGEDEIEITNQFVVPYCPFLCRVFECHINLELCHGIKSIQYVCKVITV